VSKVPTFSIKLIGQKIAREHVPPIFVLAALFIALLLTFPSLTLAVGSIIYLALIPVSAYRYYQLERADERRGKAQTGKSQAVESEPALAPTPSLALVKPAKSSGGRQSGTKS
jgi:CDP-diacylglycerol--serine O-phosphatidyltransferase